MRMLLILLCTLPLIADEARVEALLREMTHEEKMGQLSQYVPDQPEFKPALEKGLVGSLLNTGSAKQVDELQRAALANSRLKLPILVGHDVIHGYRTIFPIPLAIAATFDTEEAERSARIAAREARAAGIRWTFAPMLDIARDPRWGRIAESPGEDPYLGSQLAAAYVRGFQGEGVLATAKHFAAYGAAEGGRDYGRADISESTLRNVYLPPFEAAAQAGVATFMSAFNTVGDVPATANRHLLRDILRDEWKFRGFVVADFAAVAELMNHGIAATRAEAAQKALQAGVDMDMWDGAFMTLAPSPLVDEAVRRVLRAKFAAGLFDDPYTSETAALALAHADARRIAQKSVVLLKNDGALLPLARSTKIALVGTLAESKEDMLGSWAAEGKPAETLSVREGLQRAGATLVPFEEADVVVAVFGETRDMSGEAASRSSLELPQQKELEALVARGKPVVLLVMSGRPLAISWAAQHVPAILQTWFLGTQGGAAIADVLFGDVNPSGRLPVTFPRATGQVPQYHAALPTGRPADPTNKFTSKYSDVAIEPLYPFGHGLSYTTFAYRDLRVTENAVSVEVRNSGKRAGDEVVLLFIRDVVASVSRPVRELKGFRRISLKPGEAKRVEFPITRRELQFWMDGAWVVEPGEFEVTIGDQRGRYVQSVSSGNFAVRPSPDERPRR